MTEPAGLPQAQHETHDVPLRPLLLGGVGTLLLIALLTAAVGWLYPSAADPSVIRSGAVPAFPAPALQSDPPGDMAAFHARQLQQLDTVWWIDRAQGRVHQPVADAMRRLAATGIPDWPTK